MARSKTTVEVSKRDLKRIKDFLNAGTLWFLDDLTLASINRFKEAVEKLEHRRGR